MTRQYLYTIAKPFMYQDVNAVCVSSETPLDTNECLDAYEDYWKTRKKIPHKDVVVEQMGAVSG